MITVRHAVLKVPWSTAMVVLERFTSGALIPQWNMWMREIADGFVQVVQFGRFVSCKRICGWQLTSFTESSPKTTTIIHVSPDSSRRNKHPYRISTSGRCQNIFQRW